LGVLLVGMLLAAVPAHASDLGESSVIHVVKRGETLFSIARRYGVTVEAICAANGIADPSLIYAGQRLVIPVASVADSPGAAGATHIVQPGENLFRIAQRYGTTVTALAELNGIYNPGHIVAGQTLVIPGSPTMPTVAYQPQHASTTHTVQPGETLAIIAHRYSVALWTLVELNSIANPALIMTGQVLAIPRASGQSSAPGPAASGGGKRIVIDLSQQHLYAYQGGTLAYSFVASTGMPGAGTRTGTFSVLDKYPNAYASTWSLQMPYWLGIYWAGSLENGIHALPILPNGQRLWEGYLGTPVSFGCIILGTWEARTLYEWAEIGTPVIIQP
ncbi:MAG: LysM peptidoglycan-binding domain-containing protein, partial [Chloroflexi bacterium]|nr:LysM peptidoglycan-binding domain-containing protein [Chloroflexota bacterium]